MSIPGIETTTLNELAMTAIFQIDAMDEKATTEQARADIRTLARLAGVTPELLWRHAFEYAWQATKAERDKNIA